MLNILKPIAFSAVVLVSLGAKGSDAATMTYDFMNIPTANTSGDSLVGNFSMLVSEIDPTSVAIQIASAANAGATYRITDIYIDDSSPTSFTIVPTANSATYSLGTVSFGTGNNLILPQGNNTSPTFQASFSFDPNTPNPNVNSVQQGETVGFVFGGIYSKIVGNLNSGDLRFGFHLQSIPKSLGSGDGSDAFVNNPSPVPLPAAAWMLIVGLGGLAAIRRRKTT